MSMPRAGTLPGISARVDTTPEKAVIWGNNFALNDVNSLFIGSSAVDATNTPTTTLRAGLLMGKKTSDSKLYQWDAEAVDGTELVAAVLYRGVSTLDEDGVAEDKAWYALLRDMPLLSGNLLIKGTALTGHADEMLARRQLAALGFRLDDELHNGGQALGTPLVNRLETGTTLTPTELQNGYRFILNNAAAVAVTLPAIHAGLVYEFLRIGDEELSISSAAGNDVINGNDAAGSSITFTTAGEHVGACVRVEAIRYGTTVRWLPSVRVVPFGTNNTGLTFGLT